MSFTGFDKQETVNLAREVVESAHKSCEAIVNKLHSGIIVPISEAWYTPEGVTFFEAFASDVEKLVIK